MFLPKFCCKLNPIKNALGLYEILYVYSIILSIWPYHTQTLISIGYHITSDGKFTTAKCLVPECLNMCDTTTI